MYNEIRQKLLSKKHYPFLLFFLLSLSPFLWHKDLLNSMFIGSADYLSPYVSQEWIAQTTSVYGPQVGGGGDYAYLLAYLFLYNIPVRILYALGMSGPVISISILAVLLFVSQLSMFLFVRYLIQEKLLLKHIPITLLSTIGAILYGFSPYLVGIIAPGHIFQIYSYMTFPLLLLFTDKLLSAKQFKWNYLIFIYYLFFLSAPAYANIGILYVTFLILGMYYLLLVLLRRKNLIQSTFRIISIGFSAVLANIWWLLPYAANFGQSIAINQASTTINEAINAAVKDASMVNIFFGRPESLFYTGLGNTLYSNGVIFILFSGLLFFAFIPYTLKVVRKGYLYLLSVLLLLGAFVTKGPNDPFGFLFNWMYFTVPGFQVFRRPVSKFYWFFLLILFAMAIIGVAYVLSKTKRSDIQKGIIGFLVTVCTYFVLAFIRTPLLIPFNVPEYYKDAKQYFDRSDAQRLLILPGFYGTYPTYNSDINNYYGVDFIPFIWPYQIVEPNSSDYGVGSPTKAQVNRIVSQIRNDKPFCNLTNHMGISHIIIRHDINSEAVSEGTAEEFLTKLRDSKEISEIKSIDGITILTLQNNCTGTPTISVDANPADSQSTGLSTIRVTVKKHENPSELSLLSNETSQWKAYVLSQSETFHPIFSLLHVYPEARKVKSSDGTRNQWQIAPAHQEKDIVLYYQSQSYVIAGFTILIGTQLVVISLVLYAHAQRNHKKSGK